MLIGLLMSTSGQILEIWRLRVETGTGLPFPARTVWVTSQVFDPWVDMNSPAIRNASGKGVQPARHAMIPEPKGTVKLRSITSPRDNIVQEAA